MVFDLHPRKRTAFEPENAPQTEKEKNWPKTPPVVGGGTSRLVDSGMYRGVNVFPLQKWTKKLNSI